MGPPSRTGACRIEGGLRGSRAKTPGVQGLGFRLQGSGFGVQGLGFRLQGSVFRVQGLGFRLQGSGFRV